MDVQELVHGHLRDILKAGKRLNSGDADRSEASVHRIRVALRRLDALFGLFDGLKNDRGFRKAFKKQQNLRKSLGKVRELDVHRARWKEWAEGRSYFQTVDKELKKRREKALEAFQERYDRGSLKKTVRKMEKALAGKYPGSVTGGGSGLSERLEEIIEKVLKDRDLHKVRLDIKRLRYSLEGLAALDARGNSKDGDQDFLKELQGELGGMHDLQTLSQFLRKLRKKRGSSWDRRTAAGVEKMADDVDNRLKTERRRWDKLWPERRKRLLEIVE